MVTYVCAVCLQEWLCGEREAWQSKFGVYINWTGEKPSLEKQTHSGRRNAGLPTDMRRLTTGIRFEKYVVRRFRRCGNVIDCTCTNLDSIAYFTPRLHGIAYCSKTANLYNMLLYWIMLAIVTQWYYSIITCYIILYIFIIYNIYCYIIL